MFKASHLNLVQRLTVAFLVAGISFLLASKSAAGQPTCGRVNTRPARAEMVTSVPDLVDGRAQAVMNFVPPNRFELLNDSGEPYLRIIRGKYFWSAPGGRWLRIRRETYLEMGPLSGLLPSWEEIRRSKQLRVISVRRRFYVSEGIRYRVCEFEMQVNATGPTKIPGSNIEISAEPTQVTLKGDAWINLRDKTLYKFEIRAHLTGEPEPAMVYTVIYKYARGLRIPIPKV